MIIANEYFVPKKLFNCLLEKIGKKMALPLGKCFSDGCGAEQVAHGGRNMLVRIWCASLTAVSRQHGGNFKRGMRTMRTDFGTIQNHRATHIWMAAALLAGIALTGCEDAWASPAEAAQARAIAATTKTFLRAKSVIIGLPEVP
jgi:hypothetical protein